VDEKPPCSLGRAGPCSSLTAGHGCGVALVLGGPAPDGRWQVRGLLLLETHRDRELYRWHAGFLLGYFRNEVIGGLFIPAGVRGEGVTTICPLSSIFHKFPRYLDMTVLHQYFIDQVSITHPSSPCFPRVPRADTPEVPFHASKRQQSSPTQKKILNDASVCESGKNGWWKRLWGKRWGLADQSFQEFLEFLHLHRPVKVLLCITVHLLRVIGVGIHFFRKFYHIFQCSLVIPRQECCERMENRQGNRDLCRQ